MTQTLKNALAMVLLAGVAVLGYIMFIQRDSSTLIPGQAGPISEVLLVQASSFIEKRTVIESLAIDTSILLDERFVNLNTYTASVPEQPVGKISLFESAQELTAAQ